MNEERIGLVRENVCDRIVESRIKMFSFENSISIQHLNIAKVEDKLLENFIIKNDFPMFETRFSSLTAKSDFPESFSKIQLKSDNIEKNMHQFSFFSMPNDVRLEILNRMELSFPYAKVGFGFFKE